MQRTLYSKRDDSLIYGLVDILDGLASELYPKITPRKLCLNQIKEQLYTDFSRENGVKNEVLCEISDSLREQIIDYISKLGFMKPLYFMFTKAILASYGKEQTREVIYHRLAEEYDIKHFRTEEEALTQLLPKLSNYELIIAIRNVCMGINMCQHPEFPNLYLFRYNKNIQRVGFNKLALACRSRCVDVIQCKTVSVGYDKFFNVGESEETSVDNIHRALAKSRNVYLSDKKDGYCIIITPTKEYGLLIHTNGEFDNKFIKGAKELIQQKYPDLISTMSQNYSYIFEYVDPNLKLIVDYGDEWSLTLTNIRFLPTGDYVGREVLEDFASCVGVSVVAMEKFRTFEKLLQAATSPTVNKEGWVCRVQTKDGELIFKLKTNNYLEIADLLMHPITEEYVFQLMFEDKFDDFYATLPDRAKLVANEAIHRIEYYKQVMLKEATQFTEKLITEENIDRDNLLRFRHKLEGESDEALARVQLEIIKRRVKDFPSPGMITQHLLAGQSFEEFLEKMTLPGFRRIKKYVEEQLQK